MAPVNSEVVILSGNTHPELADEICKKLGLKLSPINLQRFQNRETQISIPESVRSKEVYVVQTATHTNVNDAIMELLLISYTCRTSAAKNIVGVVPYLPYAKQAKQRKRGAIPSRLLAKLIAKAGFTHLITIDLHHREIQGFFDIPCENLRASPFLIGEIHRSLFAQGIDRSKVVIVARHPSLVRKANAYAARLRVDLAVLHGNFGDEPELEEEDGRSSPPPVRNIEFVIGGESLPILTGKSAFQRSPLNVVGDVDQKIAILVDDTIDDVEHYVAAAKYLKEQGAFQINLVATHALFSDCSAALLKQSLIDEIVVTNSVPHDSQAKILGDKLKTIDISILLTEAIRRIHNHESLSYLFNDVSVED